MTNNNNVLSQLSDAMTSLVDDVAPRVVQVGGRHGRPATGTVFAPERILVAAHSVDRDSEVFVRRGAGDAMAAEFVGADPATSGSTARRITRTCFCSPTMTRSVPGVSATIQEPGEPLS